MFEFKITLDDNEYLQFQEYHLSNNPLGKKSLMAVRFIIPIFPLFVIFFNIKDAGFEANLIVAIVMTILLIIWIARSKKEMLNIIKGRIKNMRKIGVIPYHNEVILKFDDESIYEITPNTEHKDKYSLIKNIAVTEKAIYIYVTPVRAYILPVTAFSEVIEKQKFLEFINMKVDNIRDTK